MSESPQSAQPDPAQPDPGQQPYPAQQYPGQPYPGQPYPGQPGGRPPRKRKNLLQRAWFWILVAVVVIVVIAVATSHGGDGGAAPNAGQTSSAGVKAGETAAGKPAPRKKERTAGLGDIVKAGDFEFSVAKVKDDVRSVGNEFLNKKAQGRFIEISVTVKNVSDSAHYFMGDDQKLVDAEGKQYSADSEAAAYVDDSNSLLEEINPGNTSQGIIVFDVPKGVTPKYIEFSGSLFGSPVKVALS